MCGIAGITRHNAEVKTSEIELMAEAIFHRGPDHTGYYREPGLALASTRLSILDLSHGADMPLWSEDGSTVIVYNGEIYNYREIRANLVALGHTFRTTGDTEVVLAAWKQWGVDSFRMFDGMFGVCIYDVVRRRIVLSRDRFGEKNVYYVHTPQLFGFASEIKALWKVLPDQLNLDDRAVLQFIATDHVDHSMFREIRSLEPASFLEFDVERFVILRQCRYYELIDWVDEELIRTLRRMKSSDVMEETNRRLHQAVTERLLSDAPVGVLCSGGVDSSLIALHAARQRGGLEAFTVDTPGALQYSERHFAEQVCRKAAMPVNVFDLDKQAYLNQVVENIYFNDIPPAILGSSIGLYYVSNMAREKGVKVLLSGEGADEIFCGYFSRYRRRLVQQSLHGSSVMAMLPKSVTGLLSGCNTSILDQNLLRGIRPVDIARLVSRAVSKRAQFDEIALRYKELGCVHSDIMAMSVSDLEIWISSILLRTDRSSMQASVEARIPFLDADLVTFALNMPIRHRATLFTDKLVLKRLLARDMGRSFSNRAKIGFGVPYHLQEMNLPRLFAGGFVVDYFGNNILKLAAGTPTFLNKLIILEMWHKIYIERLSLQKVKSLAGIIGEHNDLSSKSVKPTERVQSGANQQTEIACGTSERPVASGFIRRGDTLHFSATILAAGIGLISSVVAASFLTPVELGTIQTVLLLAGYLAYMDFGVVSGLFRNIPLHLGRGDEVCLQPMVDATWLVLRFVIGAGIIVGVGVMLWGFVVLGNPLFGWAGLALLVTLALQPVETLMTILFRGAQQFYPLGKRLQWKNGIMCLTVFLPVLAGAYGLILRNIIHPLVGTLLLKPGLPFRRRGKGRWGDALSLSRIGFPILIVNLLTSFLMVADRSIIAVLLGAKEVGQYALASLILAGFPVLPASLGAILYPRAAHTFGRHGSSRALFGYYWKSMIFNIIVILPTCAFVYFALPPAVHQFLPAYSPGIPAAQITCLSSVFLVYLGQANILVVVRRNFFYSIFLALSIALVWGLGWFFVRAGWGIEGVAAARLVANATLCAAVVLYSGYVVWKDIPCDE
jgi:asparagine synthase (glutamine-hydrolysing)